MSTTPLSTRCDSIVYSQIKQAALEEQTSIRRIIEKAWNFYHKEKIRSNIISSYNTVDDESYLILEEDMNTYYQDISHDL